MIRESGQCADPKLRELRATRTRETGYWTMQDPGPPSPVSRAVCLDDPEAVGVVAPGAPLSRAVLVKALRICWFVFDGWQLQMSAATADTCGVAIDVPSHAS